MRSTSGTTAAHPGATPEHHALLIPVRVAHAGPTADERLAGARARAATALSRDHAAAGRDLAAEARDMAVERHDAAWADEDRVRAISGAEILLRAAGQRVRAARERIRAAEDRAQSAADRRAAARDRAAAASDRSWLCADLEALTELLAAAETDVLTGARTRAAGLRDLDRELERCRRSGVGLCVAYLDVVGLKVVNDRDGHGAGDELLRLVAQVMREHLRRYDLMVRLGGDEFLCVMSDVRLTEVHERFAAISDSLAAHPGQHAITAGFAQLRSRESAAQLVARADAELVLRRRSQRDGRDARTRVATAGRTG